MYKENMIDSLLTKKREIEKDVSEIDLRIPKYRKGSLFNQSGYYYLKWYENGKTLSNYVGKNLTEEEINNIKRETQNRKTLERRKKEYLKELNEINKLIARYGGKLWTLKEQELWLINT